MDTMPELFNFSKHMRSIIGGALKVHGFKSKGTSFIRENEKFVETIEFQRMRHHDENEWGFFIILLIKYKNNRGGASDFRLDYPTKITMPDYYKEFFLITEQQRPSYLDYFTGEQQNKISEFNKSREWYYHSEEELVSVLQTAVDSLSIRGFHYFKSIEELLELHLEWSEYVKERKKLIGEINVLS